MKLRGTVDEVLYQDSRGWTAARFRDGGESFRVVGNLGQVRRGETWALTGKWEDHQAHGRQFRAASGTPILPENDDEMIALLSGDQFPGIGTATAARLVKHYGQRLWHVLEREPETLERDGILTPTKTRLILAPVETLRVQWQLFRFLAEHGLPLRLVQPLTTLYQDGAVSKLEENPYRLLTWLPWSTVDQVAQKLQVAPTDPRRITAALHTALSYRLAEGDTATHRSQLSSHCSALAQVPTEPFVKSLEDPPGCVVHPQINLVQLPGICYQERNVARVIAELSATPRPLADRQWVDIWLDRYQSNLKRKLDPEQREAVHAAVYGRLLVLTGGPGTGKTTVIDAVHRILHDLDCQVEMAAPTGRAARRMQEATGSEARTLHRMFGYSMRTFDFEKAKALSTLIVDEASMVELRLFNCIAGATAAETRLIMVGDSAQLPPVGPGRVFHDLVETARLPVVELKTIHRQASENPIPHAAAAIRRGETPELPLWQGQTKGACLLPVENEREGQKCVVSLMVDSLHQLGYALEDMQILTPRRGGLVGTQELNRLIRARLGRPAPGIQFTVGDRVIQTVNNYDLGSNGIMNGQTGTVISVIEDGIVVDFEGEEVEVSALNLSDLDHAYVVTVHKAQGSQYPVVILPLYASAGRLLNRALVYTAITRAVDLVLLVGTLEVLARAVADQTGTLRTTAFPYHLSSALAQTSTIQASTMIQQRLLF